MKRLAGFALLIALLSPPLTALERIIPITGHTRGANGTLWTTDLMLFNSLPKPEGVGLIFRRGDGTEAQRVITLDAGESKLITDAADPALFPGETATEWLGQMKIVSDGGVLVSARIYTRDTGGTGGTLGSTYPVLEPASMTARGLLSGIAQNAQSRTNLALVNPSAMTLPFALTIRDGNGFTVVTQEIAVEPYRSIQIPFASLDDGPGARSLEWQSPAWDAYVMASIVDNASGDPTAVLPAADGRTSLFFPVVGRTVGAFDTNWATSLALTADSDMPGSVTLELRDNAEGLRTTTMAVAAHGTLLVRDVYDALGLAGGTGSLSVRADVPLVGYVRVYNTVDGRTYGSPMQSQDPAAVNVALHIRGVRISSEYRFNVAITNSDASNAGGFLRLYDNRREMIHSQTFDVPAHTTMQFPLPDDVVVEAGELVVQPNQNRALTAIGSNIDNRTGDTVIIEGRE